jgi:hypothetical protein
MLRAVRFHRIAVAIAVCAFALAGAATAQGVSRRDSEHQSAAAAQKAPQPEAQPRQTVLSSELERIASAIEAYEADANSPGERNHAKQALDAEMDTARWAFWMFVVAAVEIVVTAIGVVLVLLTLRQTRRIGQAQVRSYINIKSAAIYFSGKEGLPFVDIVAVNSGQSPAREFMWRPQIRYFADDEKGAANEIEDGWGSHPGIDIAAGSETESPFLFVVADFNLLSYIAGCESELERLAVAVCIDFSYLDVFGQRYTEAAYFAGVAELGDPEENKRKIFPANTSAWYCHLNRIARTPAWDEDVIQTEIAKK